MSETGTKSNKFTRVVVYILVLFVFQELVFRLCFPVPELKNFDRVNYLTLNGQDRSANYWRNKARYWESTPDTAYKFMHYLNQYGFRDDEWSMEKESGKKRAIFIGDSFVEGAMAEQDETITAGFENADASNQYETFNCGLMGMGLGPYLQLGADIVPNYKPDVVFLCIYANDLGQKPPAVPQLYMEPETYSSFVPRLVELFSQWSARGPLMFRWNGSSEPFLPTKDSDANPWNTDGELFKPHVEAGLAAQMRAGTFNPFRTNNLLSDERHLKIPPQLGETIPFMKYTCDNAGAELVVVYIPNRNQTTRHYIPYELQLCQVDCNESMDLTGPEYQLHQRTIADQCNTFQVRFIDLTQTVKQEESKGNHLYWNYDDHMRAKGYLLLGETIWKAWKGSSS